MKCNLPILITHYSHCVLCVTPLGTKKIQAPMHRDILGSAEEISPALHQRSSLKKVPRVRVTEALQAAEHLIHSVNFQSG